MKNRLSLDLEKSTEEHYIQRSLTPSLDASSQNSTYTLTRSFTHGEEYVFDVSCNTQLESHTIAADPFEANGVTLTQFHASSPRYMNAAAQSIPLLTRRLFMSTQSEWQTASLLNPFKEGTWQLSFSISIPTFVIDDAFDYHNKTPESKEDFFKQDSFVLGLSRTAISASAKPSASTTSTTTDNTAPGSIPAWQDLFSFDVALTSTGRFYFKQDEPYKGSFSLTDTSSLTDESNLLLGRWAVHTEADYVQPFHKGIVGRVTLTLDMNNHECSFKLGTKSSPAIFTNLPREVYVAVCSSIRSMEIRLVEVSRLDIHSKPGIPACSAYPSTQYISLSPSKSTSYSSIF